jgi:hypothetical protein
MNRSFLHSLANSPAMPQVPCMPACGHVLQMADELASANIPRAVERESAACVARNVKCRQTGRAEIIAQHTDGIIADHVLRAGDGKGRDRNPAGEGSMRRAICDRPGNASPNSE